MKKNRLSILFFVSSILFMGCGEKLPEGMPPLYPVRIHLAYENGSPVSDAILSFSPESGPRPWSVATTTDTNGNAEIRTHGRYWGMPAGNWKIVVKKELRTGIPDPGTPSSEDPESVKAYEEYLKSPNKEKIFTLVDKVYRNKTTTPLEIKVEKGGTFDLKIGKPCKIQLPKEG